MREKIVVDLDTDEMQSRNDLAISNLRALVAAIRAVDIAEYEILQDERRKKLRSEGLN